MHVENWDCVLHGAGCDGRHVPKAISRLELLPFVVRALAEIRDLHDEGGCQPSANFCRLCRALKDLRTTHRRLLAKVEVPDEA